MLAAFVMLLLDYTVRSWRWAVMLRVEKPDVRVAQAGRFLMASIALNNVLPFRAGDVTRAIIFPPQLGISRGFAAATLVLERLLDLVFVLLLMAIGLFFARDRLPEANILREMAQFAAAIAGLGVIGVLGAIVFAPRLQNGFVSYSQGRSPIPPIIAEAGVNLFGSIAKLRSGRIWTLLLPASALVWVFEAGVFWAVLSGLGSEDAVAEAPLLGSVGTLATLVPSAPGYIGTFHFAVQQAASLLAKPSEIGSSVAILAHAVLWLGTSLIGFICLLTLSAGRSPKQFHSPTGMH